MPNTITPQELEDLRLPELGRNLRLKRAGWIRPTSARNTCEAVIDEMSICVLYCEIVDGHAMKFGTTRSLEVRQKGQNQRTINNILAFQDGRYRGTNRKITDPSTYDKYKRMAPEVIRSNKRIEVWATSLSSRAACQDPLKRYNARCTACKDIERELNKHYKTVEYGWASRHN